jgi:C-terminal processing protease CtpA/Prc
LERVITDGAGVGVPVLRIRGWGDDPDLPLIATFDRMLEKYRGKRGIVFDVRDNGGGIDALADEVTGRFLKGPVVSSVSFHRLVPGLEYKRTVEWAQPRGPWRFEGRVAVLTNEGCMSACEHFVSGMSEAGALLVGTPTSGACGWIRGVDLPVGARVNVSQTFPLHTAGIPSPLLGIAPHVWAPVTLKDLREGRDAALEAALRWIEGDDPLPVRAYLF